MGLLNYVANQGRNGDTRLAHLTPGEVVIPREVAATRPDLVANVAAQIKSMGGNPSRTVVGRGRINPKTGIEEFASDPAVQQTYTLDEAFQNILGRAPKEEGREYWTSQFGDEIDATEYAHIQNSAQPELTNRAGEMVTQAFNTNFGRPARDEGYDYWKGQLSSGAIGSYSDLVDHMRNAASQEDRYALMDNAYNSAGKQAGIGDVSKYGRDFSAQSVNDIVGTNAWTPIGNQWDDNLDLNNGLLRYDANKNKWVAPQPPKATFNYEQPALNTHVDYNTQTIEGRTAKLLEDNNPLLRQARDRALALFAQRGLLNSSMAIEAANEAMLTKAIEIAGPDAATYFKQQNLNQDYANRFAENRQKHGFDLEKIGATSAADLAKIDATGGWDIQRANNQGEIDMRKLDKSGQIDLSKIDRTGEWDIKKADAEAARVLARMNAEYDRKDISSDKGYAATLRTNYIDSMKQIEHNYTNAVNQINNSDMTESQKASAIAIQEQIRRNSLTSQNNLFSKFPGWSADWTSGVVGTPEGTGNTTTDAPQGYKEINTSVGKVNVPIVPGDVRQAGTTTHIGNDSAGTLTAPADQTYEMWDGSKWVAWKPRAASPTQSFEGM